MELLDSMNNNQNRLSKLQSDKICNQQSSEGIAAILHGGGVRLKSGKNAVFFTFFPLDYSDYTKPQEQERI